MTEFGSIRLNSYYENHLGGLFSRMACFCYPRYHNPNEEAAPPVAQQDRSVSGFLHTHRVRGNSDRPQKPSPSFRSANALRTKSKVSQVNQAINSKRIHIDVEHGEK